MRSVTPPFGECKVSITPLLKYIYIYRLEKIDKKPPREILGDVEHAKTKPEFFFGGDAVEGF